MTTSDPKIERYLSRMEQVLKPFSVSDRAEILTEIKSHILTARERDPSETIDNVLAALGEPETVANRYLLERGLKPAKPPISPVVKWLVIGFLGTMALFFIFVLVIVFHFTPMIKIDGDKGKVSFLGGNVQINDIEDRFTINGHFSTNNNKNNFIGEISVDPGQDIDVPFGDASINISTSSGKIFGWNCSADVAGSGSTDPKQAEGKLRLDLTDHTNLVCNLSIPKGGKLRLRGNNGEVKVEKPEFSMDLVLENGSVEFTPKQHQPYRFDLSVATGRQDKFTSSQDPKALSIAIKVENGVILNGHERRDDKSDEEREIEPSESKEKKI